MSTAEPTLPSSAASASPAASADRKRKPAGQPATMGYIPGSQVHHTKRCKTAGRSRKEKRPCGGTWKDPPVEIMDTIIMALAEDKWNRCQSSAGLMRMAMVNRTWRDAVQNNLKAWYLLYRHWRGPVTDQASEIAMQRGKGMVVRLNPSIPRSLPNFKDKSPSVSMLVRVDRLPDDDADPFDRSQALHVYRKITALRCSPCCGMCGTTRHASKPFWSLGMRVCKYCMQANLISNIVLYQRYWLRLDAPVQQYKSLIEAVAGRVFYFPEALTPRQRLEYSTDKMDYPGGKRLVWFFWKPHLEKVLDLSTLHREAREKQQAARVVRAVCKRALVLRILTGVKPLSDICKSKNIQQPQHKREVAPGDSDKKAKPIEQTTLTSFVNPPSRRKDPRSALLRLHMIELLDVVDLYHEQRVMVRLRPDLARKLRHFEDRVMLPTHPGYHTMGLIIPPDAEPEPGEGAST